MGDFNAKIKADNTEYKDIMRIHGLGQKNEKESVSQTLCALKRLVIGRVIFSHKRIHKVT
jgi:hypothetical protein